MQCLGLAFVPFGAAGAAALMVLVAADALHMALRPSGGLPGWRRVRSWGERGDARDFGPMLLAIGAAVVLALVRGPWAWAIGCQPFAADSAAALVGMAVRGPRWPGSHRTVAGSVTFFVTAAAVPLMLGFDPSRALMLAAAGACVEALSPRGLDNLLIPLGGLCVWCVAA